ncbi:unnamed protein product [Durusdinium trenchii]|uniref:Non-specific serine/threonine protein kinase n=1 Tax=Durusdinium trenchii TaxID=1381693 RepID=A0ABP0ISX7_9DINO
MLFQLISLQSFSVGAFWHGRVWPPDDCFVCVCVSGLNGILPDKLEDLKSELKILLCLDHPHVVRLLDVYVSDDKLDIVMECMQGGELKRSRTRPQMDEEEAARLLRQMLLALSYMHSHGVIHRDLKLSNFMYSRDRQVLKLIDFGLSKFYNRPAVAWQHPVMRTCCGTLGYVAPEVFDAAYTSQCDLWSLGVIVYLLLSGEMPFVDTNEDVLIAKTQQGEYSMNPDIWMGLSLEATDFTQALLRVDPEKRMTAEEALRHPWLKASLPPTVKDVSQSILEDLGHFAEQTPLRRCFRRLMAIGLDDEQTHELREAFLDMDIHHRGKITAAELEKMLTQKLEWDPDKAKDATRALDFTGDDSVHFSEFLAATYPTYKSEDSLLRATFRRLDREAKGHISIDDIHALAGWRELRADPAGRLLEWLQASGGRRIHFPQFKAYLHGEPDFPQTPVKSCCCVQ